MQSLEDREELKDGSIRFKIWHTREHDKGDVAVRIVWTAEANRLFASEYRSAPVGQTF